MTENIILKKHSVIFFLYFVLAIKAKLDGTVILLCVPRHGNVIFLRIFEASGPQAVAGAGGGGGGGGRG